PQRPVGLHECRLRGVLRVAGRSGNDPRGSVRHLLVAPHQVTVGTRVSLPGPFDESGLVQRAVQSTALHRSLLHRSRPTGSVVADIRVGSWRPGMPFAPGETSAATPTSPSPTPTSTASS